MQRSLLAGETERKVAFVLEHGVRADRRAAEAFVASSALRRLALADYQHRVEALRMYGHTVDDVSTVVFRRGLASNLLLRLAFVHEHACAPQFTMQSACRSQQSSHFAWRLPGV